MANILEYTSVDIDCQATFTRVIKCGDSRYLVVAFARDPTIHQLSWRTAFQAIGRPTLRADFAMAPKSDK